uniref:Glutamine cyclotransferase n=1 Tax=Rhodosorus marinus TaxID=101924 RepID=A0A7S3EHN0_9RHOD|mmetsp:Transcript_36711/g.146810  ORF Transcript_36711/g.146810 Transcript_36711/m.146810 type:complete len:203 (+) Transcript_36711:1406-2014(+)
MAGFVEMVSLSTRQQIRVGMSARTPVFQVKVVDRISHDCFAFTQGLAFDGNGDLFESTGMYGESEIRRLDPDSGEILQREALEYRRFGEGVTISRGKILQLTWRSGTGFVRDRHTLKELDTWEFDGDGWGITTDASDNLLFLTDGTEIIRILDSTTRRPIGSLVVTDGTRRIKLLNDIQFIEGTRRPLLSCLGRLLSRMVRG